jgi:hypothetical protein
MQIGGYIFGGTAQFSSQKSYRHLLGHAEIHKIFQWLWKSCCQNKYKVFFWILIKDKLIKHKKHSQTEEYGLAIFCLCRL